jgi:hypothetical protein
MAQPEHTSDDELSPCAHIEEKEILIAAEGRHFVNNTATSTSGCVGDLLRFDGTG